MDGNLVGTLFQMTAYYKAAVGHAEDVALELTLVSLHDDGLAIERPYHLEYIHLGFPVVMGFGLVLGKHAMTVGLEIHG